MDKKLLETLKALLGLVGDVTLSEAVSWLEVEENAEKLKAEGHEGETPE